MWKDSVSRFHNARSAIRNIRIRQRYCLLHRESDRISAAERAFLEAVKDPVYTS